MVTKNKNKAITASPKRGGEKRKKWKKNKEEREINMTLFLVMSTPVNEQLRLEQYGLWFILKNDIFEYLKVIPACLLLNINNTKHICISTSI